MSNNFNLGQNINDILGGQPRYFYGLRRNDDGELFLVRIDQINDSDDDVVINLPGTNGELFPDFEIGVDFLDGINQNHEIVYDNLNYTQYRWDNRSVFYYVDANGYLTQRIFKGYVYPDGISS